MEIYVKISFISIFYLFFWFSNMILSDKVKTTILLCARKLTRELAYLVCRT